jgi:hypothetical protein
MRVNEAALPENPARLKIKVVRALVVIMQEL